jgi:RimJ/RimL family protein N-acetyltransferase
MAKPPVVILETKRLILRHPVIEDLDELFALYANLEITKFIPDAPQNYEETKRELEWFLNGHPKYPELGLWATHRRCAIYVIVNANGNDNMN